MRSKKYIFRGKRTITDNPFLALCQVFCIDMINAQDLMVESSQISSRYERIFSQFLQLVPEHFLTHHDLKFYADSLNISTPYLSRIVRVMSSCTVIQKPLSCLFV
jgi:hypothetical protein